MKFVKLFLLIIVCCIDTAIAQTGYRVGDDFVSLSPAKESGIFVQTSDASREGTLGGLSKRKPSKSPSRFRLNGNQFILSDTSDLNPDPRTDYVSQIYATDTRDTVIVLPEIRLTLNDGFSIDNVLKVFPELKIAKKRKYTYHLTCNVSTSDEVMRIVSSVDRMEGIKWCEPGMLSEPRLFNPLYSQQYYLKSPTTDAVGINAPAAWAYTKGLPCITVAVIDNGVDLTHPDLSPNLLTGYTLGNSTGHGAMLDSEHPHGTSVAGIIGAADNNIGIIGVASGCKILPIAFNLEYGQAEVIEYAAQHADVINCSWGCVYSNDVVQAIQDAVTNGRNGKGCVIVFATGNDGASTVSFPARMSEVIGVGNVVQNGNRWFRTNYGDGLDVMAPGCQTLTTTSVAKGSYHIPNSGTSLSAPQVAGLAALMLSMRPDLTASQVRSIICSTARDLGDTGWDSQHGYGLIDAGAAMNAIQLHPTISGPHIFCYEETYTLNGIPEELADSCVVTWSVVNAGNAYTSVPLISPDNIYCTVSHGNPLASPDSGVNTGIDVYLKATVTRNGIVLGTAQKEIIMHAEELDLHGRQQSNLYNNLSYMERSSISYSDDIEGYLVNPTCSITVSSPQFRDMTLGYTGASPSYWHVMGHHNDSIRFVLPYNSDIYTFNITVSNPEGGSCGDRTIPFRIDPTPLTAGNDIFGAVISEPEIEVGFGVNIPLYDDMVVPNVKHWHLYRTKVGYGIVFDLGIVYGNVKTMSTSELTPGYYVYTGIWNDHTYSVTIYVH